MDLVWQIFTNAEGDPCFFLSVTAVVIILRDFSCQFKFLVANTAVVIDMTHYYPPVQYVILYVGDDFMAAVQDVHVAL